MKRVYLVFCLMAIVLVGSAQTAGKFGVEINLNNPFVNADFFSTNGISARYFLSEDMVIRGTLNVGSTSETYTTEDDNSSSTVKESMTSFGLAPGIEFHIAKFVRGSIYAGGGIEVSVLNSKMSSNTFSRPDLRTDISSKQSGFGFGVGVFTGLDYYIINNLYIGTELGLGYSFNSLSGDSTTLGLETKTGSSSGSFSLLGIGVNPALRLGWRF